MHDQKVRQWILSAVSTSTKKHRNPNQPRHFWKKNTCVVMEQLWAPVICFLVGTSDWVLFFDIITYLTTWRIALCITNRQKTDNCNVWRVLFRKAQSFMGSCFGAGCVWWDEADCWTIWLLTTAAMAWCCQAQFDEKNAANWSYVNTWYRWVYYLGNCS